MDNCCIHLRSKPLHVLAIHQVKVITFHLHTIHVFQSLDLSLFKKFEKRMNDELHLVRNKTTTGFISRIFHATKQTMVEENVGTSFMQLEFRYDIETSPYCLLFNDRCSDKVMDSPHFGNEITLSTSYHMEDKMQSLDGSIIWCTPNEIEESELPATGSQVRIPFFWSHNCRCLSSQMISHMQLGFVSVHKHYRSNSTGFWDTPLRVNHFLCTSVYNISINWKHIVRNGKCHGHLKRFLWDIGKCVKRFGNRCNSIWVKVIRLDVEWLGILRCEACSCRSPIIENGLKLVKTPFYYMENG
jgi:hypothetical protein